MYSCCGIVSDSNNVRHSSRTIETAESHDMRESLWTDSLRTMALPEASGVSTKKCSEKVRSTANGKSGESLAWGSAEFSITIILFRQSVAVTPPVRPHYLVSSRLMRWAMLQLVPTSLCTYKATVVPTSRMTARFLHHFPILSPRLPRTCQHS